MYTGLFSTTNLRAVQYGPSAVDQLPDLLLKLLTPPFPSKGETEVPRPVIKCMIITGKSLTNKTPLVKNLEDLLKGRGMYGCTFSDIAQHAPIKDIKRAQQIVAEEGITVLVSLGGGSPIDAAKAIAFYIRQDSGNPSFMPHVAIPTTLSVAETGPNAGHTSENGQKIGVTHPLNAPIAIIYDPLLTLHTPLRLLLSTGLRALDHAIETQYRDGVPPMMRDMGKAAVAGLFKGLQEVKRLAEAGGGTEVEENDARNGLLLSAWESLWPIARSGPMGLSHSIGHRIGASYAIPHGVCSCLTLAATVRLMSRTLQGEQLRSLAAVAAYIPAGEGVLTRNFELDTEDGQRKACRYVGDQIDQLVSELGLRSTLEEYKVPRGELSDIASFVMGHAPIADEGKYTEDQIRREILDRIYA